MYSIAEENYIKNIYYLQQNGNTVTTNNLSEKINTKPASVTDMLKKLQVKKLVTYEKYYGVSLSKLGLKTALSIIRRHRLWEFFLVEKLQFGWEKVHTIAEELEHIASPELIEKLDSFLGYPQFDPHGDPIPTKDGEIKNKQGIPLTISQVDTKVVISSIKNQTPELFEVLAHKKLMIGSQLMVIKHFKYDNSVEIKNGKDTQTLSGAIAENILVNEIN